MATADDINTKAAVRKFLEQRSVINREDPTADSSDEVAAILESVALSFLLYPQAALSFVLQAKNVLQQITTTDLEILDYMLKAVDDVENPDEPVTDTSDLVEAQTALVEVDRLGRVASDVRAYDRYQQAINRFLDQKLAKSLKRRRKSEFERTGSEAREDLFRILAVFGPTHGLMVSRLSLLIAGVEDFRSVSLTRLVSTRTLTRVRSSLTKVIRGVQRQQMSKTAAAVELLSGAAALSSISNNRDIYDPTIDTGTHPSGRTVTATSERVAAVVQGSGSLVDLSGLSTPWSFVSVVDGVSYSVTLPVTGASNRHHVRASGGAQFYVIPSDHRTLYVRFDGVTPPATEAVMVRAVTLPTGTVAISAILSALNHVSTGLIDGTAVQIGSTGRILIYGSGGVTGITVLSGYRGTFDWPGTGAYVPAAPSAHRILGFADDQSSGPPAVFSPADLVDLLSPFMPLATLEVLATGESQISTVSTRTDSSIVFSGAVAKAFGYEGTVTPAPSYLELYESDTIIDPGTLGVFVDSVVTVSGNASQSLFAPITSIDGTKLFFTGATVPPCDGSIIRVVSPLVFSIQSLYDRVRVFERSFDADARSIQRALSPLLSKPTLAQISDAKRTLQGIRDNVSNFLAELAATVVRNDRSEFNSVAQQVTASLEERGLDRGLDLLQSCEFSSFFGLTNEGASKGNRFLKASEQVGRTDLGRTAVEADADDLEPRATTPDSNLLQGEELLEDEDRQ